MLIEQRPYCYWVAEVFVDGAQPSLVAAWFAVLASLLVNNGFAHPLLLMPISG
jgi:hypothetical protein